MLYKQIYKQIIYIQLNIIYNVQVYIAIVPFVSICQVPQDESANQSPLKAAQTRALRPSLSSCSTSAPRWSKHFKMSSLPLKATCIRAVQPRSSLCLSAVRTCSDNFQKCSQQKSTSRCFKLHLFKCINASYMFSGFITLYPHIISRTSADTTKIYQV